MQGNQSTGESLSELPWYSPESMKKTDGSAIRSRKAMLAVKAPQSHSVTNMQAYTAQHPHHRIPDSEIRLENIILGSPEYIPYRHVSKNNKSSKIVSHIPVDMT